MPTTRAIVLDIEGTTTPISFVYEVLFPYSINHLKDCLVRHGSEPQVRENVARLTEEQERDLREGLQPPLIVSGPIDARLDSIAAYAQWLSARDRKSTPLKWLQGRIWEEGYRAGNLRGEVFADVPPALEHWHAVGIKVAIFSSGSVLAQKSLFAHTAQGNLTKFIAHYFDTTTGPKNQAHSYAHIAELLGERPQDVLFVSDVVAELEAARSAGLQTLLCVRPGNRPQPKGEFPVIHSLDDESLRPATLNAASTGLTA